MSSSTKTCSFQQCQLSWITLHHSCYTILTSDKFSEWDLYSILQATLKDIGVINADICLATFIKQEYFDEIISTNIDDVLEDVLLYTEMRAGRDFEVISIGHNPPQDEKSYCCRIIKAYGELVTRDYTVRGRASHLDNPESRSFLQSFSLKDLLIVGMDPAWDKDISHTIPVTTNGRTMVGK